MVNCSFPSEPTAILLDITDVEASVINITWGELSAENQPNGMQNSTMTVIYGSSQKVITTTEHYYSFTAPEGAPPCEVYNFSVTATYVGASYTGAGCSVPSSTMNRMLPSLPDIERLNSSHTYSIVLIRGDLKLNVTFEVCIVIRNVTIEIICY